MSLGFFWRSLGVIIVSIILIKFSPYTFIFFNPFLMFFVYESFSSKMSVCLLLKAIFIGLLSDSFTYYPFGVTAIGFLTASYVVIKADRYLNLKKMFDRFFLIVTIFLFEFIFERFVLKFFEYKGYWLGFVPEIFKFFFSFLVGFFFFLLFRKKQHI